MNSILVCITIFGESKLLNIGEFLFYSIIEEFLCFPNILYLYLLINVKKQSKHLRI